MMPGSAKNQAISMCSDKVPEPIAFVECATYSRSESPVTPSHHEDTHVTI